MRMWIPQLYSYLSRILLLNARSMSPAATSTMKRKNSFILYSFVTITFQQLIQLQLNHHLPCPDLLQTPIYRGYNNKIWLYFLLFDTFKETNFLPFSRYTRFDTCSWISNNIKFDKFIEQLFLRLFSNSIWTTTPLRWFSLIIIVGSYVNFSGKVREVRSFFSVRLKCV